MNKFDISITRKYVYYSYRTPTGVISHALERQTNYPFIVAYA